MLEEPTTAEVPGTTEPAVRQNFAEWRGTDLVDCDGHRIGKLEDVYVDVETDEAIFGTVKEGLFGRHLTFVPLGGTTIRPRHPPRDGFPRAGQGRS